MKRKVIILASGLYLAVVIWVGRAQWFSAIESQVAVSRDALMSEPIDLSRSGTITWIVPRKNWTFGEGEARLSLVVPRSSEQWAEGGKESLAPLGLRVEAQGLLGEGRKVDRLVQNWYFTTDKPLDPNAKLWVSIDNKYAEYGLAGVSVYPFETTVITVEVTTPNPALSLRRPVLKLVGGYDEAAIEAISWLRLVKNAAFWVSIAAILCLLVFAWRKPVGQSSGGAVDVG